MAQNIIPPNVLQPVSGQANQPPPLQQPIQNIETKSEVTPDINQVLTSLITLVVQPAINVIRQEMLTSIKEIKQIIEENKQKAYDNLKDIAQKNDQKHLALDQAIESLELKIVNLTDAFRLQRQQELDEYANARKAILEIVEHLHKTPDVALNM